MDKASAEILERIKLLQEKYEASGQDMLSYLDGLLYSDYLTYWDYIKVDTLLSLQSPETEIPDERVFILYHQITELYFKLIINEQNDINNHKSLTLNFLKSRLRRINRYFEHLIHSFAIMIEGMEKEQFLKFRMALLPASGFQSAQYRTIELKSAPIIRLVAHQDRDALANERDTAILYDNLYWKQGGRELKTNKKTLTLKQFEKKYREEFEDLIAENSFKNIWMAYQSLSAEDQQNPGLIKEMKTYDVQANIQWPLQHFKSAAHFLIGDPEVIAATGGTNWQKYLPPQFQFITYFPALWTKEDMEGWGPNTKV